jgi:hypothetical protein
MTIAGTISLLGISQLPILAGVKSSVIIFVFLLFVWKGGYLM